MGLIVLDQHLALSLATVMEFAVKVNAIAHLALLHYFVNPTRQRPSRYQLLVLVIAQPMEYARIELVFAQPTLEPRIAASYVNVLINARNMASVKREFACVHLASTEQTAHLWFLCQSSAQLVHSKLFTQIRLVPMHVPAMEYV